MRLMRLTLRAWKTKFLPILSFALIFGFAAELHGQQQNITAQNVTTNTVTLPASDAVPKVTSFSGGPSVIGSATYFYWFVSRTGSNVSTPSGPLLIATAPASLSSTQYVSIQWAPVGGAVTSYDVLRTTTSAVPSGACNCAVALATTLTTLKDTGAALQAYTVSAVGDLWTVSSKLKAGVQTLVGTYQGTDYPLAPQPAVIPSVPIENGSVITVDGVNVTTVNQALGLLPVAGGVIDARSCAASSLALGAYDPGSKQVQLLLGSCVYTFSQVTLETGEQIIGSSSSLGTLLISSASASSSEFKMNASGNALFEVFQNLYILPSAYYNNGNFNGTPPANLDGLFADLHTNVGHFNQNYFINVTWEGQSGSAVHVLGGTQYGLSGEAIQNYFIDCALLSYAATAPFTLSGSIRGWQVRGSQFFSVTSNLSSAFALTANTVSVRDLVIDGNEFNEVSGATLISNDANSSLRFTHNFFNNGSPTTYFSSTAGVIAFGNTDATGVGNGISTGIPTFTGTPVAGHAATWNNTTGQLADSGGSPVKLECANGTPVTVSNTTSETNLMTCTIPAGDITAVGQDLHIGAAGNNNNSSGANANYVYKLYIDSTVIATHFATNSVTGDKNTFWNIDADAIFTAVGSGGSASADGTVVVQQNINGLIYPATQGATNVTVAFNTTTSHTIKVTVTLGVAALTVAPSEDRLVVERLGP